MGSGGGGSNQPEFPAEMRELWGLAKPMATRMATAGLEGQPLWSVPDMPQVPGPVMPSAGWFQGIAPEVRQGLWAPYQEAGEQLGERLGAQGQRGSARGGYSGAYGAAMGNLAAEAGKNVGLQAWQMTAPQMQQYRDQLYQGALQQRGDVMQAQQAPFSMFPSYMGGMGQLPMYAQPNQPSPWLGAAGGAMSGGAMGASTGNPWLAAAGAGLGGLYGYYSYR